MPRDNSIIAKIGSFIRRKISQKHRFNQQYEKNLWGGLRAIEDLGRYSLIVGYSRFFFTNARILDLGCGEGVLLERFTPSDYSYYQGIDISDVAIDNARKNGKSKAFFMTGDLNTLYIEEKFDVIIYNESLYYLTSPKNAVKSILKNLNPDGIVIVSNFNKYGKEATTLWSDLSEILDLKGKSNVSNINGDSWTVHVYKMKEPGTPGLTPMHDLNQFISR